MQDSSTDFSQDLIQLPAPGIGRVIPAPAEFVPPILLPGHTLMDENAVGKIGQVWYYCASH
jgi:hypothetical protein